MKPYTGSQLADSTHDNGRWSKIMTFHFACVLNLILNEIRASLEGTPVKSSAQNVQHEREEWNVKELWRKKEKKVSRAMPASFPSHQRPQHTSKEKKSTREGIQKFTEPSTRANERDFYALLLLWKRFFDLAKMWWGCVHEIPCLRFIEPETAERWSEGRKENSQMHDSMRSKSDKIINLIICAALSF